MTKSGSKPGTFYCVHEAGHTVAAWLGGVTVFETCAMRLHSQPDWKFTPRVAVRWPERDRWERMRVTAAGQGAFMLVYPELAQLGEPIAADDRREFEFHYDDWDVAVAEARDDLAPFRNVLDAVTAALQEHGTLDRAMLEELRAVL